MHELEQVRDLTAERSWLPPTRVSRDFERPDVRTMTPEAHVGDAVVVGTRLDGQYHSVTADVKVLQAAALEETLEGSLLHFVGGVLRHGLRRPMVAEVQTRRETASGTDDARPCSSGG